MKGIFQSAFITLITSCCYGQTASETSTSTQAKVASAVRLPETLSECETKTCDTTTEGHWTFNGSRGHAVWGDGEIADLVVTDFDGRNVTILRIDTKESSLAGFTGVYTGKLIGNRVEGTVTWGWAAYPEESSETRSWYAIVAPEDQRMAQCIGQDFTVSECMTLMGLPTY